MGDIILWESHYNKRNMQNTVERNEIEQDSFFENDIVFANRIPPANKANYIRRFFDWDKGIPFPVVQFANSLGVKVFIEDFSKLNKDSSLKGYLAIKPNGKAVIVVSEEESYGHQRWTVAHELWHYFKHRDCQRQETSFFAEHDDYDLNDCDNEEREADQFATSLLMPEREFRAIYNDYDRGEKNEAKEFLAEHFAVSMTAVNRRIAALKLDA